MSLGHILEQPTVVANWQNLLLTEHGDPLRMVAASLLLFPRLALGLSGFETGVAVMPLVQGTPNDDHARPTGRIRNTKKLLTAAALIMSLYLITSSFVTITLIPPAEFQPGGEANGRALAYLAHEYLGDAFGTVYDLSTIAILWFAGASAMAGLLNIVPRYLPRYGMAPDWTRATRPLVLVFTAVALVVTVLFQADVDAQGGAYATGVLVLMTSASIAVTLAVRKKGRSAVVVVFGAITLIFAYTTIMNVIERPDGVRIASFFIAAIVVTSVVSRLWRVTELRVSGVTLDDNARRFVEDLAQVDEIRVIANHPDLRDAREYWLKEREQRIGGGIPWKAPILFIEVTVVDPSEFAPVLEVTGEEIGNYRVFRARSATVPNAIAAFLMYLRDTTGKVPHAFFGWSEGNPLGHLVRYVLFGEGDVAPVAHEVLREAEPDPARRPVVHVA